MNSARHRISLLVVAALLLLAAAPLLAQTTAPAQGAGLPGNVREAKLASKLMVREMPYRVIVPVGYDEPKEASARYPVIYLLHGLTGSYRNWTDLTKAADYARGHKFIIVTPTGNNGWYTDSLATPADKHESYIIKELIPEVDAKFRTIANRDNRIVAGLSMGGYGATKFGLKYPDMFSLVGSFSGALGATSFTEKNSTTIGKAIDAIYGPEDGELRKANDIFRIIREITPEKLKALPFIYQSCGTEDFLIQNNREFMMLMVEKKVPHEYRQHPGAHNWAFWDDQIREFLAVAERRLKK